MINNKRATVGTTMVWIVAMLLILVILTIYLLGVSSLAVQENVSEYAGKISEVFVGSETVLGDFFTKRETDNLISFANLEVDIDGGKQLTRNLLFEDYKIFYEQGNVDPNIGLGPQVPKWNEAYSGVAYSNAVNYFDEIYNECYFLCFYFISEGDIFETQPIAGRKCESSFGNPLEDVNSRENYKKLCNVLYSDISKSAYSEYSQIWLVNYNEKKEKIKINLFVGGFDDL